MPKTVDPFDNNPLFPSLATRRMVMALKTQVEAALLMGALMEIEELDAAIAELDPSDPDLPVLFEQRAVTLQNIHLGCEKALFS